MDLQPLVGDLASASGLTALAQDQRQLSDAEQEAGKGPVDVGARGADTGGPRTARERLALAAASGAGGAAGLTDDF